MITATIYVLAHGGGHHHGHADFDVTEMLGSFCLRIAETIVLASPTVLAGLLLAGVLRAIVAPSRLRRLIGEHPIFGPLKMALFALFVPVCAFGAIPAAQEIRRAGVRPAAVITFLIIAPMLNVLWTSYGFSATDPWLWTATVGASTIAAIAIGITAAVWIKNDPETDEVDVPLPSVSHRLRAVVTASAAAIDHTFVLAIATGLLGVGLVGALLGAGHVESMITEGDLSHIPWLAFVMSDAYVSPEMSTVFCREVFRVGELPGVAVVMLLAGAGMSSAALPWLALNYGVGTMLRFMAIAFVVTTLSGVAFQIATPPLHHGIADSHGFDHINMPHHPPDSLDDAVDAVARGVEGRLNPSSVVALIGIAVLVAVRLVGLGATDPSQNVVQDQEASAGESPWYARSLSRRMVWVSIAAGVVGSSVVALYVIYPAPGETFEELDKTSAWLMMAVKTGDDREAELLVEQSQRLLQRMRIGASIRPWAHTSEHEQVIATCAQRLDKLRDSVGNGVRDDATEHVVACAQSLKEYRNASR